MKKAVLSRKCAIGLSMLIIAADVFWRAVQAQENVWLFVDFSVPTLLDLAAIAAVFVLLYYRLGPRRTAIFAAFAATLFAATSLALFGARFFLHHPLELGPNQVFSATFGCVWLPPARFRLNHGLEIQSDASDLLVRIYLGDRLVGETYQLVDDSAVFIDAFDTDALTDPQDEVPDEPEPAGFRAEIASRNGGVFSRYDRPPYDNSQPDWFNYLMVMRSRLVPRLFVDYRSSTSRCGSVANTSTSPSAYTGDFPPLSNMN